MISMPSLLDLPTECVLAIMTRLPVLDVVCMASCCSGLRQLARDDCFWAALAEAKWGAAVRDLKPLSEQQQQQEQQQEQQEQQQQQQAGPSVIRHAGSAAHGSWQRYCYKRMSARTIRRSPLELLQEGYPDPWQHIVCCVLCSRTSGSSTIRSAVAAFFEALPTPTAVLAASDGLLQDLLHPLGLQANRMAAVRSVSHNFLATDWHTPVEFHGCGKFVEDSWRIFCRGHRDTRSVTDANLRAYLAWHNRQPHKAPHSSQATAPAAAAAGTKQRAVRKQVQSSSSKQLAKQAGSKAAGRRTSARLQEVDVNRQAAQPAVRTRAASQHSNKGGRCTRPASDRAVVSGRGAATAAAGNRKQRGLGVQAPQCKRRRAAA